MLAGLAARMELGTAPLTLRRKVTEKYKGS
jgi:hypothetical protein